MICAILKQRKTAASYVKTRRKKLKERGFDSSVVQAFYYLIAAEKRQSLADRATAEGEREG